MLTAAALVSTTTAMPIHSCSARCSPSSASPTSAASTGWMLMKTEKNCAGTKRSATRSTAYGTTDALTVSTEYDLIDRVTKATRPGSRVTTTEYDALGQVAKVNEGVGTALARTTGFAYDAAGNLVSVTDPLNRVIPA